DLFGPEDPNANVVTAIRLPETIDGAKVPKLMRDRYGITIAGGQGQLKGKIARVAHCGYFGAFDIVVTISAFEMTLRELGHVVVASAPQSSVITAAEHTMAMLLALARNVPQAHSSLVSGGWERSRFSGVEINEKVLGILGFGRIGQLVAQRALGFGMRVIAFD